MLSIKETFLIQIRRTDTLEIINDNDSNKSKLVKVGCMWVYRRDMHGGGGERSSKKVNKRKEREEMRRWLKTEIKKNETKSRVDRKVHRENEQDRFTNSGVLSQVHALRQARYLFATDRTACVRANTLESLSFTHCPKNTHTYTHTHTYTSHW